MYLEGQNQIFIRFQQTDAIMRMRIHKYYLFSRWLWLTRRSTINSSWQKRRDCLDWRCWPPFSSTFSSMSSLLAQHLPRQGCAGRGRAQRLSSRRGWPGSRPALSWFIPSATSIAASTVSSSPHSSLSSCTSSRRGMSSKRGMSSCRTSEEKIRKLEIIVR